jgi:cell shape-determining protein MreD
MTGVWSTKVAINSYLIILGIVSYVAYNLFSISMRVDFVLISIFFFSLFPQLAPNIFVIMISGMIQDINYSHFIGLTSLQYALLWSIAMDTESSLNVQKFNVIWATFSIIALISMIIKVSIDYNNAIHILIDPIFCATIVATIAFYPILHNIYASVFLEDEMR